MHVHQDRHDAHLSGKRLFYVVLLNLGITLAELIGGLVAGSLALVSDSLHNFSDAMSVIVTYFAHRISSRGASERKTFGYRRATILAALFNSATLLVIGAFLIREAVERLLEPSPVDSLTVLWVAVIGLFANLLSMYLLGRWSGKSISIRSAYLHMLSDALSSIAVIVGAIAMISFGLQRIDSILTIGIAIYVIRESFKVMSRSLNILMQAVPERLDINELVDKIREIEGVKDVHHVHVWNLDEEAVFFEGHVNLKEDVPISKVMELYDRIERKLSTLGISHVTIQVEYNGCPECGVIKRTEGSEPEDG